MSKNGDSGCRNLGQLNGSRVSSTGRVWVVFLCSIACARSYTLGYRGGWQDHRLSLGIQPKSVLAKSDFRVLNILFVI